MLGKMHDTSDKFKEGNGILITQDYLKKVTVMVDKLLQLAHAVSKPDMYIQLLNIHDNLSYKQRLVKLVEETGDLVTKNRDKHGILGMQGDLKVKLCDRLKMLENCFLLLECHFNISEIILQ